MTSLSKVQSEECKVKSFGIFQISDLKNEIRFVAERHLNSSLFILNSSLNFRAAE